MKIKNWLLLSYLVVMILPLIAAYLLFAWINSFNNDLQVGEYINISAELQEVITTLDDPELYHLEVKARGIEQIVSESMSITLYNGDGLVIYTSNPINTGRYLSRSDLYKDLYKLEQGYRAYTYKQPVFDGQQIVGFFDVQVARDEWTAGVSDRSWLMLTVFAIFFSLIYFIVIWSVNRKLNRRLSGLMNEMSAFAAGNKLKKIKENNDEIGVLTKSFYGMADQIHEAQKVIEQEQDQRKYMIATLSHDLKTPLTSIKAYAESLEKETGLTEIEQMEYRQVIMEKSDFMKQMLDDLLTYTLLQSSSYQMELVEVDGGEFFEMLLSDYEPICKSKNLQLEVVLNVVGGYEVNPKQMIRVVDNLMSNAIQHTNEGKYIWLAAISEAESLPDWLYPFVTYAFNFAENCYLIVQDEGKGITNDKMEYVFDPLYQTDQARSKKEAHGTGLGLSITKQMVEQHGGNVYLFSREKIGTCIICAFPKIITEDEDIENAEKI